VSGRGAAILGAMRWSSFLPVTLVAACASANMTSDDDGVVADATEGDAVTEVDAPEADGAAVDATVVDAAMVDAAPIDAMNDAMNDARVDAATDAATDAAVDASIDAMCTPTWQNLLGNGGFDNGVAPWTQTSTSIRDATQLPFNPHQGTHAAMLGIGNNANDVIVQTVTIPASATGLRVRGYQCFVTEDVIADTDTFRATLETPGGAVLETLLDITNSDTAPICLWTSFTWTAASAHAGQTIVLRMRATTNIAFLTRFIVDTMSLEYLGC
jgi:hypothetical protein